MIPSAPTPTEPATELEALRRRDAWYRLKVTQDFLVLDTQLKAHRQKLEVLRDELDERNRYIHELHAKAIEHVEENVAHARELAELDRKAHFTHNAHLDELHAVRVDLGRQLHLEQNARIDDNHAALVAAKQLEQTLRAEIELFTIKLREAEETAAARQHEIARMKSTWGWGLSSVLRKLQRRFAPLPPPPASTDVDVPAGTFTYYLHTSPYRMFHGATFTLRGWVFPTDGRAITALRVRLAGREFLAQYGIEEPEVVAQHGPLPQNPRPGFSVEFATPPGRQQLRLEAQLENREWRSILSIPIWCEAS